VIPLLSFVVGTTVIAEGDTAVLNVSNTYQIACLAVDSKPDVNLEIFDSDTFRRLGNAANSQSSHNCDANNLCSVIYSLTLVLGPDSPFLSTTSLTCQATSVLPQINLLYSISRNVRVINGNQPVVPTPFQNSSLLIGTALSQFTIVCNTTITSAITWIRTANKTGQFFVPFDNRVTSSNNGQNLNFASLALVDEEYYACAYQNTPTTYRVIAAFYLYVKVFPVLSLAVNNVTYNSSDVIQLSYPSSTVYQMICYSANSKPDVTLSIYDSNSSLSLGNSSNAASTYTCDTFGLCNVVYVVNFELTPAFLSMTSLSCGAKSVIPEVNLDTVISRRVLINVLCKFF
jgi:hypothetical protein